MLIPDKKFIFKTGIKVIFLFIAVQSNVYSAEPIQKVSLIGIRSHYGFIIPHSTRIRHIAYSNPWKLELDFAWHHLSEKAWNYCNCFSRTGITLSYINFDNPSIMGSSLAVAPYIEPILFSGRHFSSAFRLGGGLAYLNNIYDPVTNPVNLFYGARLSFILFMNFSASIKINEATNLRLSANYNHISNGGNIKPNSGVNFPTASIGLDYYIQPPHKKQFNRATAQNKGQLLVKTSLFYLTREFSLTDKTRFPVFGFQTWAEMLVGRISALSLGLEYINDLTQKERITRYNLNVSDHHQAGLLIGHVFRVGRFSFAQSLGFYIHNPLATAGRIYQRYGLEFRFYRGFSFGTGLKAHLSRADFLDFRLSYSFR